MKSEWISVEDCLPAEGVWVIALTGDGDVAPASLCDNDYDVTTHDKTWRVWWWKYSTSTVFGITHWMPLPEPPEDA